MTRISLLPLTIALLAAGCTSKEPSDTSNPPDDSATLEPQDEDGDGYLAGDAGGAEDDCDDSDADTHPGATELCDGVDNDCDGEADDGVQQTFYADEDGDGLGDAAAPIEACQLSEGMAPNSDDCDDGDPEVGAPTSWYADADGDGYGDAEVSELACEPPAQTVADASDCDDTEAAMYPGAEEDCDGLDNDCDGTVDALEVRYDPFDDFDATTNPSGAWSHGWSETLGGELELFDTIDLDVLPGLVVWKGDAFVPRTVYNPTGATVTYDWGGIMPSDQIVLHPGRAGEYVAVEWTAPYAGVCDLSVTFTDSDHATTDLHVLQNAVALWDDELEAGGSPVSWSTSLDVAGGDALAFTLGYGSNEDYTDDSTAVDVTLSCVFTCE